MVTREVAQAEFSVRLFVRDKDHSCVIRLENVNQVIRMDYQLFFLCWCLASCFCVSYYLFLLFFAPFYYRFPFFLACFLHSAFLVSFFLFSFILISPFYSCSLSLFLSPYNSFVSFVFSIILSFLLSNLSYFVLYLSLSPSYSICLCLFIHIFFIYVMDWFWVLRTNINGSIIVNVSFFDLFPRMIIHTLGIAPSTFVDSDALQGVTNCRQ